MPSQRLRRDSLSRPHPLADAAAKRGKLAKASLRGAGRGEGVFEAIERIWHTPQTGH